jgi:uncharacterized protein (TIGR00303 family)
MPRACRYTTDVREDTGPTTPDAAGREGGVRLALVAGTTATAEIDGLSAAGADPRVMRHTPGADLDILVHGEPTIAPVVPVSPTGCPTPAVVTRAVRDLIGFDVLGVDAGIAGPTGAPTIPLGADPGRDVRDGRAVPTAGAIFDRARDVGRALPDEHLVVSETIPGGTTTALGVLTALGEPATVSSSLPENPLGQKRRVVDRALAASDLAAGDAAGDPLRAVAAVGDPVLAAATGLTVGCVESGTRVTLGGGTQLAAVAGLVRHLGVDAPLSLATTSFVADDGTAGIETLADRFDVDLHVTDPQLAAADHPATDAYLRGEAKEGAGMGGALRLFADSGVPTAALHDRIETVYDRLLADRAEGP